MTSTSMLTEEEWALRQQKTGKLTCIMRELEKSVAVYGPAALTVWHVNNGLREKPRFRVKAKSQ